ncbi:MAG: M20/M25/M40 family metallo-hydrolase, partial [Archaeoglobaceae archaeon]
GEKIKVDVLQAFSSPNTPENSEIAIRLSKMIEKIRKIKTRFIGIGGNTCASFLRSAGFKETVAWCTAEGTAHKPNEYCVIDNMVEDAKVFYSICFDPEY